MSAVRFRPEAEEDLLTIALYAAEFSLDAANALIARLRKRCAALQRRPLLGRPRPEFGDGIRCLVERPYILLYRIEGETPEIVAILHGARDLPAVLKSRIERESKNDLD
jgi:toxin ParE1/3/4